MVAAERPTQHRPGPGAPPRGPGGRQRRVAPLPRRRAAACAARPPTRPPPAPLKISSGSQQTRDQTMRAAK